MGEIKKQHIGEPKASLLFSYAGKARHEERRPSRPTADVQHLMARLEAETLAELLARQTTQEASESDIPNPELFFEHAFICIRLFRIFIATVSSQSILLNLKSASIA